MCFDLPVVGGQAPQPRLAAITDKSLHSRCQSAIRTPFRVAKLVLSPAGCRTAQWNGVLGWWSQTGSNRRPHACKARALPAELCPRNQKTNAHRTQKTKGTHGELVGLGRLELPTSRLSSARSNQLSYKPLTTRGSHAASSRSKNRNARECAAPGACSSAKKEKRRRRCPANAAQRLIQSLATDVSKTIR